MAERLQPATLEELAAAIADSEGPLEILGQGSKRGFGRPVQTERSLDLSRLSGVTLYEPDELVLTAGAGTPLREIEARLSASRQILAFEPPDLGPLYGLAPGQATLGGIVACNLSGPRRVKVGAARDYVLGCTAVNGRGEIVKTGGRVMKNVTGYDLCKLITGSFGTLMAIAEATLKVLPAPEELRTLSIPDLDDAGAISIMNKALGGAQDVSAAAHLPRDAARQMPLDTADAAVTLLRLEGTAASVEHRLAMLQKEIGATGAVLGEEESLAAWRAVRDVAPFVEDKGEALWRVSLPPTAGAAMVRQLGEGLRYFYDWGGGLVWLALPTEGDGGAARLREVIAAGGGHATLVRAPVALRAAVDVFQPQDAALAALSRRVKESFDPLGRFNPGRMYRDV
jgi:glycolate dehydrogenase FAD-binding subunit